MKKIIVIFGGISPEHDVSVITGILCLNCLDKTKFSPVPIYVSKKGEWFTGDKLYNLGFFKSYDERKLLKVNIVPGENVLRKYKNNKPLFSVSGAVNCMHGGMGENGTIGAFFELCGVPCVGTDAFSARIAMDKALTKTAAKNLGVKVVDYAIVKRDEFYEKSEEIIFSLEKSLEYPLIVKPCGTGSSIGISVAKDGNELFKSLVTALSYDEKAIVEKYIDGYTELNCAAYEKNGNVMISELEKPVSAHEILTFYDKYSGGKGNTPKREFPAKVSKKITDEVKAVTKSMYVGCNFSSVIRADFLIKGETVYLNEINSIPGSLAYYLFYNTIGGLTDLLTDLLSEAIKINRKKQINLQSYDSDVLSFKGVALKK